MKSVTWFCFLKYLYALYFSKVQWWCQDKKSWILSGVAAFDPGGLHKLAKVKGSNHASETGFCCLCRRPEEARQGQRQQPRLRGRILLLPPKTRRNSPRSKAATTPQRQDFAASAEDVKKPTKAKGSKILNLERECCFRPRGGFWVLIMPGWLFKTEGFYNSFRNFCDILLSENYFSVLLRMSIKHKSACLCTVLTMYEQKYTKMPGIGNYYRIVTNF